MLHEAILGVDLRICHPTLTVEQFERQTGLKATFGHDVRERREKGGVSPYPSTFVMIRLLKREKCDIAKIEAIVIDKLNRITLHENIMHDVKIDVSIKVYDKEFVSLPFSSRFLAILARDHGTLTIENHT